MSLAGALCAETDSEVFFPEKGESTAVAKRTCAMCEVRLACLQYALEIEAGGVMLHGIWGGKSVHERRRLRGRGQPRAKGAA